jgi:hypothetical protein
MQRGGYARARRRVVTDCQLDGALGLLETRYRGCAGVAGLACVLQRALVYRQHGRDRVRRFAVVYVRSGLAPPFRTVVRNDADPHAAAHGRTSRPGNVKCVLGTQLYDFMLDPHARRSRLG